MSHFVTLVILPNEEFDNTDEKLTELFAPYNENMEVEPYMRECYCVGDEALAEIREGVECQLGDLGIHGDWFHRIRQEALKKAGITDFKDDAQWEKAQAIEAELDSRWQKEVAKPRENLRKKLLAEHPKAKDPDPECEECKGTGEYESTYNPKSKWDWWVVGGRWDGSIQGDQRSSENGFNFGEQHHQYQNNICTTESLVEKLYVPFAIITPDGEWHERGEMCWFAVVANEKDGVCWEDTVFQIYNAYPNHFAVACDLHI